MDDSDRGAALVEAVLVVPVLIFLIFAIIEIGGVLKSYSGAASTVRLGGRSAGLAASDPLADAQILAKVADQTKTMGRDDIQLVVIWHASGPGDHPPAGCLPADTSAPNTATRGQATSPANGVGACNAYVAPSMSGGAFAMVKGTASQSTSYYFGCSGPGDPAAGHKLDCNWPGSTRVVLTSPRGAANPHSTDYVGLYVRARHGYYTGIVGSAVTITDQSITLIEPQGYDLT